MRFRNFLDKHRDQYHGSTKSDKTLIAIQLVLHIQTQVSPPGRFLMKLPRSEIPEGFDETTEIWYEIDAMKAAKKVAQRLREKKLPPSSSLAIKNCKSKTISAEEDEDSSTVVSVSNNSSCSEKEGMVQQEPTVEMCSSVPSEHIESSKHETLMPTLIVDEEHGGGEESARQYISAGTAGDYFTGVSSFQSMIDSMKHSVSLPTAADLADFVFASDP
jgi:hypothetical protein